MNLSPPWPLAGLGSQSLRCRAWCHLQGVVPCILGPYVLSGTFAHSPTELALNSANGIQ